MFCNFAWPHYNINLFISGVRVAVDPRNPIIAIDEAFEKLEVHSIAHQLVNIEVL